MIINNNVLIESIVASDANFTSDISADLKKKWKIICRRFQEWLDLM